MGGAASRAARQYPKAPPPAPPPAPSPAVRPPAAAPATAPAAPASPPPHTPPHASTSPSSPLSQTPSAPAPAPTAATTATTTTTTTTTSGILNAAAGDSKRPLSAAEEESQHARIAEVFKGLHVKTAPPPTIEHRLGPLKTFPQLSRTSRGSVEAEEEVPGSLTAVQVVRLMDQAAQGVSPAALAARYKIAPRDVEALLAHLLSPWKIVPASELPPRSSASS